MAVPDIGTDILFSTQAKFEYPHCVGLMQDHIDCVVSLLELWTLKKAPCVISEDGTALQMRIDITYRGGKMIVFGLSGGSFEVVNTQDFLEAVKERSLASSLYAYTLIPIVAGAPHVPFFAWCHDSTNETFSSEIAIRIWQFLWQVRFCEQCMHLVKSKV